MYSLFFLIYSSWSNSEYFHHPPSPLLADTDTLSMSMIFLLLTFPINRIIQYGSFCVCLFAFSILFSGFSTYCILQLNSIPLNGYTPHFAYPFISSGPLGSFYFLAIVNTWSSSNDPVKNMGPVTEKKCTLL